MTGPGNDWVSTLAPIPNPHSPAGQLAQGLRELAKTAEAESLRDFAKSTHYSATRISEALSGKPSSVSEEGIKRICEVCNADESTKTRLLDLRTEAIKSKRPDGSAPAVSGVPGGRVQTGSSRRGPGLSGRRLLVSLSVVLVGLVVAGVVGWQLWPVPAPPPEPSVCAGPVSGLRLNNNTDGECIGITDDNYSFNDPSKATNDNDRKVIERINDVQKRIEKENRDVKETDRYVKVVLLMPLTVSQARPPAISLKQILYSLKGSYTALYRANHSRDFGDPSAVKLRLLLANQGSLQNADPDFINSILKVSQPNHPVVAVIGLGSSVPNTKTAVEYLAQQGIPMVSAATSADSLTNLHLFWSVSPSNVEYASRLKSFLDHQDVLRSGIIVYDRNPDLYTRSLAEAYHTQLGHYVTFPDQPFQGSTLESRAAPNVFLPVVTNLCNAANDPHAPMDMVFYAGRVADFGAFSEALKVRTCRQRSLTVMFGATGGLSVAQDYQNTLASSNVKVIVATPSDSSSWGRNLTGPDTPPGYAPFLAAYRDRGFDDADLLDGYAIAHHDALATAAQAIRLASLGRPTDVPNPEDVAGQFGHLNLAYTVPAASGTLSFPSEGGRAIGRPVPLTQIG